MLAAFVLTIGLTAVVALIGNSLKNSFETRDTIIAVGLAQEGAELVRNVRDNDFVTGCGDGTCNDGFTVFSNDANGDNKHCRIDYTDATDSLDCASSVGTLSRYRLRYADNFYQHNSGADSRFSRYVYIDYRQADNEALVRSFVYWGGLFTPPSDDGSAAQCTVARKCVFTEIRLTSWNTQ